MQQNEANSVGVAREEETNVNAIDYSEDANADCTSDQITMRAMHTEEDIVPPICPRNIGHHGTCSRRRRKRPSLFIISI